MIHLIVLYIKVFQNVFQLILEEGMREAFECVSVLVSHISVS